MAESGHTGSSQDKRCCPITPSRSQSCYSSPWSPTPRASPPYQADLIPIALPRSLCSSSKDPSAVLVLSYTLCPPTSGPLHLPLLGLECHLPTHPRGSPRCSDAISQLGRPCPGSLSEHCVSSRHGPHHSHGCLFLSILRITTPIEHCLYIMRG